MIAGVLDRVAESGAEVVPRIAGGLLLLVVGLAAAWLLGRLTERGSRRVGLNGMAERFGIHDVLERIGLGRSLSRLLGRAVRIALTIVVLMAAVSALGLRALSRTLNEAILFLPKLFVALVIVLVGVVVADFVRRRADRAIEQMGVEFPFGRVAQAVVLVVALLTALAQLGVSTSIVTALAALVLVVSGLAVALAFGLGGRDLARQLSAGRYVNASYRLGDRITVVDVSGEIAAFEGAAVVLRDDNGRLVRVPNALLIETVVTTEAGGS